jgi:hypothetical protein
MTATADQLSFGTTIARAIVSLRTNDAHGAVEPLQDAAATAARAAELLLRLRRTEASGQRMLLAAQELRYAADASSEHDAEGALEALRRLNVTLLNDSLAQVS